MKNNKLYFARVPMMDGLVGNVFYFRTVEEKKSRFDVSSGRVSARRFNTLFSPADGDLRMHVLVKVSHCSR